MAVSCEFHQNITFTIAELSSTYHRVTEERYYNMITCHFLCFNITNNVNYVQVIITSVTFIFSCILSLQSYT